MSDQPAPRKPGFFTRLFSMKGTTEEQEAAAAPEAPPPPPPVTPPPPAASEPAREGLLSRWFGRRAEQAPPEEPAAPPRPPEPPAQAPRGWFNRLTSGLSRTRHGLVGRVKQAFGLSGHLDSSTIESVEEALLGSDVGVETTTKIIERMREEVRHRQLEGPDALLNLFKDCVRAIVASGAEGFSPQKTDGPYVVMMVGVNGAGKTTTVGKMAKRCRDAGLTTMMVAGDTFRAAAVEQLERWSERTGCLFMRGPHGADPSGLAFDAVQRAKNEKIDVVFIDTAGRLHTKTSLMDELSKVERVIKKVIPDAPHETLLVLDATTGQNAIQQVRQFSAAVGLSGIVMTKLDGTAKGGILITIRDQFKVPVTLIGVGEAAEDLRDFDPEQYLEALFAE